MAKWRCLHNNGNACRDQRRHACEREAQRRTAQLDEPAGEQAADRREPCEGKEVETEHPPTELGRRGELDKGVRVRRQ